LGTERCEPCTGGLRYMWDATLMKGRCLPCDAGTARDGEDSSPVCATCAVGTFANESGMSECKPCPAGHTCRAGTVEPQPCGLGLYTPTAFNDTECLQCAPGTYADQMAMSSCHSCSKHISRSTSPTAARSSSECRCDEGSMLLSDMTCAICDDETTICPGGVSQQQLIFAKKGFYLQSPAPVQQDGVALYPSTAQSYKCKSKHDCPNSMTPNTCPIGHVGLVCAACDVGYTRMSGSCFPCKDRRARTALIITAGVVFEFIVVIGILRVSTDQYRVLLTLSTALGTTAGFFVTFVQLHQILGSMAVAWPQIFRDTVLAFAGIFTFNMEEIGMDCDVFQGALGVFLPKLVLFPLILLQMALIWGVGRRLCPSGCWLLTTPGNTLTWDSLSNAMGLVTNIAFVPVAVHSTGIFNCYDHPTGQMSMRSIPYMLCYEGEWASSMLPAGLISLLLFVVAPFALFVFLVCKATTMPNAAARLPFLMARFRPDTYWWGLVILSRNLALSLAMVVAPTRPFVVCFLLMSITLAYFHVVLRYNPWKYHGHSIVDGMISAAFALVLIAGIAFADTATYPNTKEEDKSDASWSFLAMFGTLPFFVSLVATILCAYFGSRDAQPAEQGKKAEDLYLILNKTVSTASSAFQAKPDSDEIKSMLARISNLSAHDWASLRFVCSILDALSLDRNLRGRVSSLRSGSSTRSTSAVGVDVDGVARRISQRISAADLDTSQSQVAMV